MKRRLLMYCIFFCALLQNFAFTKNEIKLHPGFPVLTESNLKSILFVDEPYVITAKPTEHISSYSVKIVSEIKTVDADIVDIEIQYGKMIGALNSSASASLSTVYANETKEVSAIIENLEPTTRYYYRIKANYKGEEIYGSPESFHTGIDYRFSLNRAQIDNEIVTLSARMTSYIGDVENIVFEYGTLKYDNQIVCTPNTIKNNAFSERVEVQLTNLDVDSTCLFRLKTTVNGNVVYSRKESVFNFTGEPILVSPGMEPYEGGDINLKGLVHLKDLQEVEFEYGLTEDLGNTI